MSVLSWTGRAAFGRLREAFSRRVGILVLLTAGGLLSACAAPPAAPLVGPNPADPSARVSAVGYRSTIGPYARRRPVEPAPWLEQNERVAPAPGQ